MIRGRDTKGRFVRKDNIVDDVFSEISFHWKIINVRRYISSGDTMTASIHLQVARLKSTNIWEGRRRLLTTLLKVSRQSINRAGVLLQSWILTRLNCE